MRRWCQPPVGPSKGIPAKVLLCRISNCKDWEKPRSPGFAERLGIKVPAAVQENTIPHGKDASSDG